jgi:dipeptidyl aminopeptidase/acylaminoacyl peptidase
LALLTGYDPAQSPFTLPEAKQINSAVSPQMTAVIQRATQIQPEHRWQSTADMQKALTTGSLPPLNGVTEGGSKKPWWIIGAFLLLILLGFGVWAFTREDESATVAPTISAPEIEVTRLLVVTSTAAPQEPVEEPEVIAAVLVETPIPAPVVMPTDSPSPTALPQPSATPPPTDTPIPTAPDRIVFQSNRDGDFEIYIINVDGSNLQQLTNNSNIDDKYPAVSPDGRRIAFQAKSDAERDSGWEIYVMDIDGRNQTRLTSNNNWDRLPTWSPDGRQIAFISDRGGQFAVYVMDANGQNVTQVSNTGERDGHVSWSINNQLVWNTGGDSSKTWRIVTSNVDGRNLKQLAGNGNWSPEWSPDGRSIVFVSSRIGGDTNPGIFLMNADGSNQRLLVDGPGEDWGARWSNDGQYIVYTASPNNADSIYMIPVNGGTPILITNRGSYPAWVNGR